ncbi:MAG: PPIase cyclophilin-type protein [Anaerolineales bacterium]|nr:PPIase cyclophilin-type protein [Anaerolineales bacterium]
MNPVPRSQDRLPIITGGGLSAIALSAAVVTLLVAGCTPGTTANGTTTPSATRTPIRLGPTSTPAPVRTSPPAPPEEPTSVPIPPVGSEDWRLGPDGASVELLVYADFQSSNAALGLADLLGVYDRHHEEIQVIFRHFPVLPVYDKDSLAGQAAEAAGRQGLFWEMVRLLASRYPEWSVLPPEGFREWLSEQAPELGLDPAGFAADLDGGRFAPLMVEAFQEASEAGIPGVPTVFLNGVPLRLSLTPLNLESAVRLELLTQRQYDGPPAMDIDLASGYTATLVLDQGEVVVQLLPQAAPEAVNSFVFLARQGWFDGMTIFRVEPGALVETGDPSDTGFGDAGYHLPDEIDAAWNFDEAGVVALSSAGPGSGGSRFFITLQPLPLLNGSRTVFGRVVEGLDLLMDLPAREPALDMLSSDAVVVRRVRIEETE